MQQNLIKSFILMRNLSCRFITVQNRPVLRQGCLNPKDREAFTKHSLENTERNTPIFVTRCFLTTNWLPKLKKPWTSLIKVVFSRGPLFLCLESYRLDATIIDCSYLLCIYKWMDKSVFRGLLHFIPFFWAVHKNHKKLLQLLIHVQPNLVMG